MADPTIIGNYQILRFLGEGGMGRVYVALHTVLEREVVVKSILPELASHPEIVRRFLVEARAAAKLAHRNIVVVHDASTDQDGVPFLALEFLKGQSLRAWLDQHKRRRRSRRRSSWRSCSRKQPTRSSTPTVKGIVHRDIKPDNVFLVRAPPSWRRSWRSRVCRPT
jgi:serine/threonine protein kinase